MDKYTDRKYIYTYIWLLLVVVVGTFTTHISNHAICYMHSSIFIYEIPMHIDMHIWIWDLYNVII